MGIYGIVVLRVFQIGFYVSELGWLKIKILTLVPNSGLFPSARSLVTHLKAPA